MVDTNKLRGAIVSKGLSQRKMAMLLGITDKTFYEKMKKKVFDSDEIEVMMEVLKIENPTEIFFAKEVT